MLDAISWLANLGKILNPQAMKTVWVIERFLTFQLTKGP